MSSTVKMQKSTLCIMLSLLSRLHYPGRNAESNGLVHRQPARIGLRPASGVGPVLYPSP
jgi:hypothetical protein